MAEFHGLVTLTLDRVILHTVMHHSSTSTHIPNFVEIKETFCVRTNVRTVGWTFETHFIRSTRRSRLKSKYIQTTVTVKYIHQLRLCARNAHTMTY